MDTLYVGKNLASDVAALLARTRAPHMTVRIDEGRQIEHPVVETQRGMLFTLPAIVDFILHRVTEPALVDIDPTRRGLQMTVFWALIDREWPNLMLAEPPTVSAWFLSTQNQLNKQTFYTGDTLNICDMAMACIVDTLMYTHRVESKIHRTYVQRVMNAVEAIASKNLSELRHA